MLNELLRKLVGIESVNPEYGGSGEAGVGAFVCAYISGLGLVPESQEVAPGRCNIYAKIGPKDRPVVMLEAHMDTVSVNGWAIGSPFELVEREGKLWGRGSCDTKASLAVFLEVLRYFSENAEKLKYGLVVVASVDEEAMQSGAFALAELQQQLGVSVAITGEPTLGDIVHAHKGACHYTVSCSGKAAHGSTPELGRNAIYAGARLIGSLESLAKKLEGEAKEGFIESGSLNLGLISGGSGFNIVADSCEFHLDRRVGINEDLGAVREELRAVVESSNDAELKTVLERPALNTPSDHWFPQEFLKSVKSVDASRRLRSVGYMTNAVAYASVGVPSLVFGPGDIAQAHKSDEYIEIGEMEKCYEMLIRFLSL